MIFVDLLVVDLMEFRRAYSVISVPCRVTHSHGITQGNGGYLTELYLFCILPITVLREELWLYLRGLLKSTDRQIPPELEHRSHSLHR